ncbi:MAG: hypothetical protein FJZ90_19930 [Chloroflexi bacterium]|nr:hypothetical protein [Chloroflexota bacterium]
MSPLAIIILGFVLVILGVIIPLLMVLKMLPVGFLLCFLAFASSVAGVLLGVIGASRVVRRH